MRTPWGETQSVQCADGLKVWWVTTASHGGAKVSPYLAQHFPLVLRNLGDYSSDGIGAYWYEEDCDYAALFAVRPDIASALGESGTFDEIRARFLPIADRWCPNSGRSWAEVCEEGDA